MLGTPRQTDAATSHAVTVQMSKQQTFQNGGLVFVCVPLILYTSATLYAAYNFCVCV